MEQRQPLKQQVIKFFIKLLNKATFCYLQVRIVAEGKQSSSQHRTAVDNITISTKTCERSPPHSSPGTENWLSANILVVPSGLSVCDTKIYTF